MRGLAETDSREDDDAAKIDLTYSTTRDINRARPTFEVLVVRIIQVISGWGGAQPVEELGDEQEVGEVVDREVQLVTFGALVARAAVADARVGDEDIDAVLGPAQFLGQAPHRLERAEIGAVGPDGRVERRRDRVEALLAAAVQQQRVPSAG